MWDIRWLKKQFHFLSNEAESTECLSTVSGQFVMAVNYICVRLYNHSILQNKMQLLRVILSAVSHAVEVQMQRRELSSFIIRVHVYD